MSGHLPAVRARHQKYLLARLPRDSGDDDDGGVCDAPDGVAPLSLSRLMARLRRDTQDSGGATSQRPLRVVASGTLFVTHNLGLPTHPDANSVVRAHSVSRDRGGSASTCLSVVAQFPAVDAILVAPLGGNEEGRRILAELEKERVSTRYCKIWPEAGVPSAWVLHAGVSSDSLRAYSDLNFKRPL